MKLDAEFDSFIIICAFRYCLGRHTYAPGIMMDKIDEVWDSLDEHAQKLIIKEIEDHHQWCDRIDKPGTRPKMHQWDLDAWLIWARRRTAR